jgi:hypothetical protein
VGFNEFNNFIHSSKNWILVPFFEAKVLLLPNFDNNLEFGLNLSFFGGSIDEILDLFGKLMKLKLDKIVKAELW